MDITILKKLGLNDKEITVYLKLLEYGAISVRSLAELAGLNRGTTYDILKKLQESGLVSFYHQDTKQKFVAEEPAKLLKLLEQQEDAVREAKVGLEALIPELKSLQDTGGDKPVIKLYEGKAGVRFILEDVLSSVSKEDVKEYYVYSATYSSEDIASAYPDFTKDRIKKNIKVKAISLAEGGKTHGLDERRWLGTRDESATFVLIYADKCAFLSRDAKGAPVGVIIENQMIFTTQKIIFRELWQKLK
jgi:sugar-specific transcriptional regulator TrmB